MALSQYVIAVLMFGSSLVVPGLENSGVMLAALAALASGPTSPTMVKMKRQGATTVPPQFPVETVPRQRAPEHCCLVQLVLKRKTGREARSPAEDGPFPCTV